MNEGDAVSPEMVIGDILDIEKVKIPLGDFSGKVNDGQEVKVKIKKISRVVAGTVAAGEAGKSIVIANPVREIQAGMQAMFKVLVKEHKDVVVLPQDRILKDDTGSYVFLVNWKYAKKSILTLGPDHKNDVMITAGLAGGDEIVVKEILSSKKGTLKDEIQCVTDNKRIKICVKHDTKNKYVKRKKKAKSALLTTSKPHTLLGKQLVFQRQAAVKAAFFFTCFTCKPVLHGLHRPTGPTHPTRPTSSHSGGKLPNSPGLLAKLPLPKDFIQRPATFHKTRINP